MKKRYELEDETILSPNSGTVDNYYMHELGHVLGAHHPGDAPPASEEFGIESGKQGVMCKDSCFYDKDAAIFGLEAYLETVVPITRPNFDNPPKTILNAYYYSDPNKERILGITYDYKDALKPLDNKRDQNPTGSINERRNLNSVATAASTSPPPENIDSE